jgi:hypothetical protein
MCQGLILITLKKTKITEQYELDSWKLFLNAMRSPVTRDRYSTRVPKVFDFIEIPEEHWNKKPERLQIQISHDK